MIKVQNLLKRYGQRDVVQSISFHVPPGQICGLLGPNGAGKSTTLKMLTGLLQPTSGSASVAGFDVATQALQVKKRIGYVPEVASVYTTLSAREYLTLVAALHDMEESRAAQRIEDLLKLMRLTDSANHRLETFSKGMRQKTVIAAALMHDPDVLFFDEPLSGLDANAVRMIRDLVKSLADSGKTILYCSHVLDVVERLCPRVVILHQGQVVADGPTKDLLAKNGNKTLDEVFQQLTKVQGDDIELANALLGNDSPSPKARQ
jgi:ABC-2 type transport system ATP-binding protein